MFDTLHYEYEKIINSISIIGYKEDDILQRGKDTNKNLPLSVLFSLPYSSKGDNILNSFVFEMMFPEGIREIDKPRFFYLALTNEKGQRSFLYCLKFPERITLGDKTEIEVPMVICINSNKEDMEPFRKILEIISKIINDIPDNNLYTNTEVNNYKMVEIMNIFYYLLSLIQTPPHSMISIKINSFPCFGPIDFYFPSFCEIPCTKTESEISLLFQVLDQNIVIRALLALLLEKQVILRSSRAFVLHITVQALLKLLFPFKWIQTAVSVLPRENLALLDAPNSFIFGVLAGDISIKEILNEYPGKVLIDCDSNQIFGENEYEPYSPKETQGFSQGQNTFFIEGSHMYNVSDVDKKKDKNDKNNMKVKGSLLIFAEKSNLVINTEKSQIFLDTKYDLITSSEWVWLRKNIQLVTNPDIFEADSLNFDRAKFSAGDFFPEDSPIIPSRSYAYNIQNILMTFYLNKLKFSESDFMTHFKKTNLYIAFNEPNKYQNDSGKVIVENILETKHCQRGYHNCFNIQYEINNFNSLPLISSLTDLINNIDSKEDLDIYKNLKKVFLDYARIKGEDITNFEDKQYIGKKGKMGGHLSMNFEDKRVSVEGMHRTTMSGFVGKIDNFKSTGHHKKNTASILEQTSNSLSNNFFLSKYDETENHFEFYSKKGFIYFLCTLAKTSEKKNFDINSKVSRGRIYEQIRNEIYLICEDLIEKENTISGFLMRNCKVNNNKEDNSNENKSKENNNKEKNSKEKNEKLKMSLIKEVMEQDEADNSRMQSIYTEKIDNNNDKDNNNLRSSINVNDDINDEEGNLINIINKEENENIKILEKDKMLSEKNELLISYPDFSYSSSLNAILKTNKKNINNTTINHISHYYLFLAFNLEYLIKDDKNYSTNINESLLKKGVNLNTTIMNLYIRAYEYCDKRDFPYFKFYSFLNELKNEELYSIKIKEKYENLYDIYSNIVKIKKEKEGKLKKLYTLTTSLNDIKKTDNKNLRKFSSLSVGNETNIDNIDNKINNIIDKDKDKEKNDFRNGVVVINKPPMFNAKVRPKSINIIIEMGHIILSLFPNIKNLSVYELVAELVFLHPEDIKDKRKKIIFWVNAFNFLLIFTILNNDLKLSCERDWKLLFRNVKYKIGKNEYSFEDMQYILFGRILFFPSSQYKPNDIVNKCLIGKDTRFLPFLLSIPISETFGPLVIQDKNLEKEKDNRVKMYLLNSVKIDQNNILNIPEYLVNLDPNFLSKSFSKYANFFDEKTANFVYKKKWKKIYYRDIKWELNFEYLKNNLNLGDN